MGHLILGINVDDQHSDDPYVLAFSWMLKIPSELLPPTLSVMLAYRIWYVDRNTTTLCDNRKSELRPILYVIIDAGMIYSFTMFTALICFVNESNSQYVVLGMVSRHATPQREWSH